MSNRPFAPLLSLSVTLAILSAVAVACTSETYDTGDGSLSYMRADFAELITNSSALIEEAVTDDDIRLTLDKPVKVSWATAPDSAYRALLYYKEVESGAVTPITAAAVLVPAVRMASDVKEYRTDPLQFDSAWRSRNDRYINLGLTVRAGSEAGSDAKQEIGIVCRGVVTREDGTREARLTLSHNQNGMPQYYSVRTWISIPVSSVPGGLREGDGIVIEINTYDGIIYRTVRY